jgi:hypothetical protein
MVAFCIPMVFVIVLYLVDECRGVRQDAHEL